MSRIAIIGAGLSGRLLALNLLRFASSDAALSFRMLDRGDERDMGPAYSVRGRLPAVERPGWTHGSLLGGSRALLDVEPGQRGPRGPMGLPSAYAVSGLHPRPGARGVAGASRRHDLRTRPWRGDGHRHRGRLRHDPRGGQGIHRRGQGSAGAGKLPTPASAHREPVGP